MSGLWVRKNAIAWLALDCDYNIGIQLFNQANLGLGLNFFEYALMDYFFMEQTAHCCLHL